MLTRFAILLVLARVAHADPAADVRTLVTSAIAKIDNEPAFDLFAHDAMRLVGKHATPPRDDFSMNGTVWSQIFDAPADIVEKSVGTVEVVMLPGNHVAWFAAPVTVSLVGKPHLMHVTGVARDSQSLMGKVTKGWGLDLLAVTTAVPDAVLVKTNVVAAIPAAPDPDDTDKELTAAIHDWFAHASFAAHAATSALAIGTAPPEVTRGAAAIKLATSWEHLKLQVTAISASNGQAIATAWLPVGKGFVALTLIVGAVKEAGEWRWVSLQFAPTI